jgi:hypothetical protein
VPVTAAGGMGPRRAVPAIIIAALSTEIAAARA